MQTQRTDGKTRSTQQEGIGPSALGLKGPSWSQRGFEGGKTRDWHFVLPIRRGPLEDPQEGRVA